MIRYIKKPLEVDAVQYTGDNFDEIKSFCRNCNYTCFQDDRFDECCVIFYLPDGLTLFSERIFFSEKITFLYSGDYIILSDHNVTVVSEKEFRQLYDIVVEGD